MAQGSSHENIKALVRDAIAVSHDERAASATDSIVDAVLDAARAAGRASNAAGDVEVTSVRIRRGGGETQAPWEFEAARAPGNQGWPFPFSGRFCFWFCPDGVPEGGGNSEECYEICIEWWFP